MFLLRIWRYFFFFLRAVVNIPVQTLIFSPWFLFCKMIISQLELGLPVIWFHFSPGSIYYQLIRTRFTRSPSELEFPFFQIYNGNWTEWSAVWAEIPNMSSDRNCMTRGSITTLLYPFRNRLNTRLGQFKYFIDALLSQFEIKFIHFFWGGRGNIRVLETKVAKLPHDTLSFSCNLIDYFKQALKSDWSFCFKCSLLIGWEKDVI